MTGVKVKGSGCFKTRQQTREDFELVDQEVLIGAVVGKCSYEYAGLDSIIGPALESDLSMLEPRSC